MPVIYIENSFINLKKTILYVFHKIKLVQFGLRDKSLLYNLIISFDLDQCPINAGSA